MRPIAGYSVAFVVAVTLSGCDRVPTVAPTPVAAKDLGTLVGGTADISLTASGTMLQNGDVWSLAKNGSLSGSTVTWTITATKTTVVNGQLLIDGQVTLTNSGDGPATIGNVVVNLQQRVNNKWVTKSSDIANATQGDGATTASIHAPASSENLGTFAENSASGALEFRDATTSAIVSLVPQLLLDAAETRTLLFSAAFDNNDAALQLTDGTPIRAEVIVTFGNATVNGNSTANVDINGNGAIDADEAHVRSVSSRLALAVPAAAPGGAVTLTDALEDITVTGDVTFSNAQFTIGATTGTVTATVDGGATGGSITNCAHLTTVDQSLDLTSCSTVDVAAEPPDCTPGAAGCGWQQGDMLTFTQTDWGEGTTSAGTTLISTFNAFYPLDLVVGNTNVLRFTNVSALFLYLPQGGPAGVLTSTIVNPLTTSAGELGGEVTALKLNVDHSAHLGNAVPLSTLKICALATLPTMNGQTVSGFLTIANNILGGGSASISAGQAAALARFINAAFVNGTPSTFAQNNLFAGACPNSQPGALHTFMQNEWGDVTNAAGVLLTANFMSVYGAALIIGDGFRAGFTTAAAITTYLPAAGTPMSLTSDVVNPVTTSSGELGGEILALKLNIDFSAASLLGTAAHLGSLRFCNVTGVPVVNGQTVNEFLASANTLLGGGSAAFSTVSAAAIARSVNEAFPGGIPSTFAQNNLVAGACP